MLAISWLNDNAGFTMALLTAIYVIATLWIVTESRRTNAIQQRLLQHSESLERARNRPHVIFSIDFVPEQRRRETVTHAYARVRNIGVTSAHDVLVTTSPVLRGRLGIGREPRQSALVGTTIAFMPPTHEVKDLLAYVPFLFEDNSDEQLRYGITVTYSDGSGTRYEERYSIDVAAQKEALELVDGEKMILFQIAEQMERTAGALDTISRTLDSPDRSTFMHPIVPDVRLSMHQRALLQQMIDLAARAGSQSFFAAQYVGHECATIRSIGEPAARDEALTELEGRIEDVEYLCRTGALHGYYRHGSLRFSLTPLAEHFAQRA